MRSPASSVEGASSNVAWLDSLSPWPREFGLGRMRALLASFGNPQLGYPAIHVVGTNGKSTATKTIEALLVAEGLRVGATVSPHVRSWSERVTVDGEEVDFEAALARVRPEAEVQGATQFEIVTAAALAEFAACGVDVAVVEAGLGGRLDATNVLRSHVVLLTSVGLDHTDVLGGTREEIAREKLAVVQEGSIVVLPDLEFAHLAGPNMRLGGAHVAAEAFLGRPVERGVEVRLPGRLEVRSERPLEIWDGAHNLDGVRWLVRRLPERDFVLVTSILADKQDQQMLMALWPYGKRLITTQSSNARAWDASELAATARSLGDDHRYRSVEAIADPVAAVERARGLAGRDGAVLVTGSLYLLGDLAAAGA